MYYALFSDYWDPSVHDSSQMQVSVMKCYSNWIFPNDVTSRIVSTSGSQAYDIEHITHFAISGFYGQGIYKDVYLSKLIDNPWIRFNFDDFVQISTVILTDRRYQAYSLLNIEIKIGNTTNPDDYVLFADYYGPPLADGSIAVFRRTEPLYGKHVLIQKVSSYVGLLIPDIKFLS